MTSALDVVPLLFLALAPAPGGGTTRAGARFRVVCDFENPAIAEAALEAAEAAWPLAAKLCGAPDARPPRPLEIHLFRTEEAYAKADREQTGGRFRDHLAFTSWGSRSAYVLLQPQASDDALRALGLPRLTRRLVAHEAFHLVRATTIPNHASHPDWFADGAAIWIASEALATPKDPLSFEEEPYTATFSGDVQRLLGTGRLPSARRILLDETAGLGRRETYAVRALFFRFLKVGNGPIPLDPLLAEIRRLGGGPDFAARLLGSIEASFGADRLDALDAAFQAFVRSLRPEWDEVFRSLEPAAKDWIQIAFPGTNAIAWRTEAPETPTFAISGVLEILPGPGQQMNLLLDRKPEGFLSIAFVAGHGVTVLAYHSPEDRWERLADAAVPGFRVGEASPFRASIGGEALRVSLKGKERLVVPLRGRALEGTWGLGAQAGSAGIWRRLRLEP